MQGEYKCVCIHNEGGQTRQGENWAEAVTRMITQYVWDGWEIVAVDGEYFHLRRDGDPISNAMRDNAIRGAASVRQVDELRRVVDPVWVAPKWDV